MKTYALSGTTATAPAKVAQDTGRHTPRAAANHLSVPEQAKRDAAAVDDDVAALHRVQASKPSLPPHRRRDWREAASPYVQTCNECGRSIMPHEGHFADQITGHLVRHAACHESAKKREARS